MGNRLIIGVTVHLAPAFALNFCPHHFVPFDHHLHRVRCLLSNENIRAKTRSISACTICSSCSNYSAGTYTPRRHTSPRLVEMGGDGRPQPKPSSPRRKSEQNKHQAPKADALYHPVLSALTVPALAYWLSEIALWIVKSLDQRKQAWPRYSQLPIP
ncbi:hypothetical protein FN846DRAFT_18914 [Sphaerosporella brunnea]|uniref:Uncharacterized protein n=1 Tax=Sphaerosporella brunnea TaxID=1250544 RepID=A0A5J5EV15_9PEZI|nr:hypothetical protein FN846DRAFT_18914 [Sphaerosporella brunnea]